MPETTDKPVERECNKSSTSEHVAAEALACTFDPKHAAEDTSGLHEVRIVDTEAEAQIQQNAELVREALTDYWTSPDSDKLINVISGMTVQGRQDLIANYDQGETKFWEDAKYHLTEGSPEYAAVEVLMNEKAATGTAGDARVAMAIIAADPEKGVNLLRAIAAGKTGAQIETLNRDYQAAFGTTFADAIKALDPSLMSQANKDVLDILLTGSDKIGPTEIANMARIAMAGGEKDMLINVLSGVDGKDIEARSNLLDDQGFMAAAAEIFRGIGVDENGNVINVLDQEVAAALNKGGVALDAILTEDVVGIYDNIENSNFNFEIAPEQDRQAFRLGRDIVESGRAPASPIEREAVSKYNDLIKAFENVSPAQRAALQDRLLHGEKTLISDIAESYSEGGLFGIGSGFYNHDALAAVENMSAHEYGLLKDPAYKQEFDRQIAAMIDDEALRTAVMNLVNAKLNVEVKTTDTKPAGYTDSLQVRRSLDQFMSDLADSGTYHADRQIAARISSLNSEEIARYNSDPTFKAQVDEFAAKYVTEPNAEALVNLQLSTAGKEKTETQVKLEQFLNGQLEAEPANTDFQGQARRELRDIAQVEELMKDPELLARMKQVGEQMRLRMQGQHDGEINPQDQLLYDIFQRALPSDSRAIAIGAGTFEMGGVGLGSVSMPSTFDRLLTEGEVPFNTKLIMARVLPGDWLAGRYEDVAKLSAEERAALKLTPEQQAIVDNAVANGGKLDLAGRFREFAVEGGDIATLMSEYSKLPAEKREELAAAYKAQFGAERDLFAEALTGLSKNEEMSEEEKDVWERVIGNKGEVQLVDRLQLHVLGVNPDSQYSDFRAELSKLTPQQRFDLKRTYSSDYKGNLDDKFLADVPEKDIDRYRGYLSLAEVDAFGSFFQKMARYEDLGTFDGTSLSHQRILQVNENLLRRFNDEMEKLPLEAQEKIAEHYAKIYQEHMDSNEEYANFIADMTVTAMGVGAAILLTPATGGASLGGYVAAMSTVGAGTRVAIMAELQGGAFDSSPENLAKIGFLGAVEMAISTPVAFGKAGVTGVRVAGREMGEAVVTGADDASRVVTQAAEDGVEAAVRVETTVVAQADNVGERVVAETVETNGDVLVAQTDDAGEIVAAQTNDAVEVIAAETDESLVRASAIEAETAQEVIERTAAREVVEHVPAQQVIEPAPATEVLEGTQATEVLEQTPASEVLDQTRATEVIDQAPATEVIEREVVDAAPVQEPTTSITADGRQFDIPTGFVDLGNMIKAAAPEDRIALIHAAVKAHPTVQLGSWMRLIEPSEMDVFLQAADSDTLTIAGILVRTRNLRPHDSNGPIDFQAWDAAIARARANQVDESTVVSSTASAGDELVENVDETTQVFDATPPADRGRRAPAAFAPEEAVADDLVIPAAVAPEEIVDDATRLAQLEKKVASGEVSQEVLEASARNGDSVAQQVVARIARAKAEEEALLRTAMPNAFEAVRLAAVNNHAAMTRAANVLRAAVAPSIVSETAEALEAKVEPVAQVVEQAAPLPSKSMIEMATVRLGEGPWQSAERILAASGQKYDVAQVRALTRAFQASFKIENNGNGDMGGLKVGHNFITAANFDDVIANCKDEKVKAFLIASQVAVPAA
jgi:hypothetical protein